MGGKVIVSYSVTPREDDERFFEDLRDGVVGEIFLENGFKVVDKTINFDGLKRDIEWKSGIYQ